MTQFWKFVAVLVMAFTSGHLAAAWTGSDLVQNFPTVVTAPETDSFNNLFPARTLEDFFKQSYDTQVALKHAAPATAPATTDESNKASPFHSLWPPDTDQAMRIQLRSIFQAFVAESQLHKKGSVNKVKPGRKYKSSAVPSNTTFDGVLKYLAEGHSFVFKFERLKGEHPYSSLERDLFNITGLPISVHLYISAANQTVLEPHTDPYDVLVLQLQGHKHWRTCTPRVHISSHFVVENGSETHSLLRPDLTPAQRCMLQELQLDHVEGCTIYSVDEIAGAMDCHEFDLRTGDVLYMPKVALLRQSRPRLSPFARVSCSSVSSTNQ